MTRRVPTLVAGCCAVALVAANLIPPTAYSERSVSLLFTLFAACYVVVGAVLAARLPGNPLGWLLLGMGTLSSLAVLCGAYASYGLLVRTDWPFAETAAWTTSWIYWPVLTGTVLMILLFPEGRLTGALRTWTARTCLVAATVMTFAQAVSPGPIDGFGGEQNPVGITALGGVLATVRGTASAVVALTFLVALWSIFARWRRALGRERDQLSWLVYATVLMVAAQVINTPWFGLDSSLLGLLAVVLAIVAFPAAMAVAVLRHRLYDIDRLISRTLVYGALTATLLTTYLVAVLLFRVLLDPVTGGSDLAVAGSTLAVAALFRPVRRRIQGIVDRRFYRRRYDAARSVESFAVRLRQQVDLDAVTADLHDVVRDTVNPAHLSVWLRGPRAAR